MTHFFFLGGGGTSYKILVTSGVYKMFVGRDHLQALNAKWEYNTEMGRQETGCEGMNWINLAQGRNK